MRRLLASSAAVLAALLLAPPAGAAVYCVPEVHTNCAGTAVPTIQAAFDLAEASAADDTVRIASGDSFAPAAYQPVNAGGSNSGALQVIGKGAASTTIVGNDLQDGLYIGRDGVRSPTLVHGLRVLAGQNRSGISTHGKVQSVVVNAKLTADRSYGISLYDNAEATQVVVDLAEVGDDSNHQGISFGGTGEVTTGAKLSFATIMADHGIDIRFPATISSVTVDTRRTGIAAYCMPHATLHGIEVLVPPSGTSMLIANGVCGNGTFNTTVDARHLTLVGGAIHFSGASGLNQLNLRSSIVADAHHLAIGNDAAAKLKVSHSLLETFSDEGVDVVDGGGNVTGVDPLFRNVAEDDLRLLWPSRAIDLGDPAGLAWSEPAEDRNGFYRIADGDGDGVARRDAGAHEYYGPAARLTATPSTPRIGQTVVFDASASTSYADPKTFAWKFGDGGAAGDVPTLERVFNTAGTHTVAVTVTDGVGRSATQAVEVTVVDPNARKPAPTPSATPTATPSTTSSPLTADFSFAPGERLTFRRRRAAAAIVVNGPGRVTGVLRTRIRRRDVVVAKGNATTLASGQVRLVLRMSGRSARLLERTLRRGSRTAVLKVKFTRTSGAATARRTRSRTVSIRLR